MDKSNGSDIQAVFFDLGNVLLPFDFGRAARKLAALTGRPEPEITWLVATIVEKTRYELGHVSTQDFYRAVTEQCGLQLSLEEFREIWGDIFSENPEMIALARSLRGSKKCHILSNTNELHIEFIEAHFPFFREFDGFTYSYRERVGKPDPKIYRIALERAGAEAGHSLFIDDRKENVEAARAVGMQGVHYADPMKSMREIRECLKIG